VIKIYSFVFAGLYEFPVIPSIINIIYLLLMILLFSMAAMKTFVKMEVPATMNAHLVKGNAAVQKAFMAQIVNVSYLQFLALS
jgi:hypothetical protein